MTWVKLDDAFPHHPKVLKASPPARYLYVVGLALSSQHLADGHLDAAQAPILHALAGTTDTHIAELVAVGLWDPTDTGWHVHDWAEHQRTRDTVEAKANAAKLGNHRRWHESRGVTDPQCEHCNPRSIASDRTSESQPIAPANPTGSHERIVETETETETETEKTPTRSASKRTLPSPTEADGSPPSEEATKPKRTRRRQPRDDLFDALVAFGGTELAELTKSQQSHIAKLAGELLDVGADPDEIPARARRWAQRFPNATLTPAALVKHWGDLKPPHRPGRSGTVDYFDADDQAADDEAFFAALAREAS